MEAGGGDAAVQEPVCQEPEDLQVYMASGAKVLEMQFAEFVAMCRARRVEQTALELKRCLQRRRGLSRFRQQLIGPDGEILQNGARLDGPMDLQLAMWSFEESSGEQIDRLCELAIYANSRGVEELLSKPLDPNLTSEFHGASALACACNRPYNRKVVDLLLEAMADPNTLDGQDRTPMFIAVMMRDTGTIVKLLGAKADPDKTSFNTGCSPPRRTPLLLAASMGSAYVVRLLLEAKADKDKPETSGSTPISVAREKGHAKVVQLLQ